MIETFLLDIARSGDGLAAERLRSLVRSANDAFFDVDVPARQIAWSRGIQLLFGHDPERVGSGLGEWQRFVHPDDRVAVVARGREALNVGTSWSEEFRFARADGSYAAVRARAFLIRRPDEPPHVVGSLADLSQLRRVEDELRARTDELTAEVARERHERIRAELLMRSATSDVLAEWVISTGEIRWSPNVRAVLGYEPADLPDIDSIAKHIHPDDLDSSLGELRRTVEGSGAGWAGRLRFRMPDGRAEPVESHVHVLRDEDGRALVAIGSVRRLPEGPGPSALITPTLTLRQAEVLSLVRLGHTNKAIASSLGVSEQAAKVQVSKLLRKFGVHNRSALVALADRIIRSSSPNG